MSDDGFKHFAIPDDLLARARELGMAGDDEELRLVLTHMTRHAAPLTHPKGNRRYHEWCFRIHGQAVTAMDRLEVRPDGSVAGGWPRKRR